MKNKKLENKIKRLINKAKKIKTSNIEFTLVSGNTSSLNEVIKTRQQGEFFMKILKAL